MLSTLTLCGYIQFAIILHTIVLHALLCSNTVTFILINTLTACWTEWCCCIDVVPIKYFTLSYACPFGLCELGCLLSDCWMVHIRIYSAIYNGANCSLQIEILLFVLWCNLLPVCDSACRIKEVQMCRQTSLHRQTFWCVWLLARTICACLAMKSRII